MKLIILFVTLTGCATENDLFTQRDLFVRIHELAARREDKEVCYTLTQPDTIRGHYCLEFTESDVDQDGYVLVREP